MVTATKTMRFFKMDLEDLLVIHDDLELDFGIMGYKKGGGLAGHNTGGPEDWYRFDVNAGDPLALSTQTPSGDPNSDR